MATGVGEASAVISVVQLGFSLATTLNTYIADYQDAKDDIRSLATEVDATLLQVEELEKLLKENDKTKGFNDYGVFLAKKSRSESEKVVQKLIRLLTKSGASFSEYGEIGREDIEISRFNRAFWLRLKPQVEVVKAELERTKIDLLLARTCYQAQSGSTLYERNRAKDRIAGLARSRELAKHMLRDAERRERDTKRVRPNPSTVQSKHVSLGNNGVRSQLVADSDGGSSDDESVKSSRSSDTVAEQLRAQIKAELEAENREKERERINAQEREQEMCNQAVDHYKNALLQKMQKSQLQAEDLRSQLRDTFQIPLPEAQLNAYIQQHQLRQMEDDVTKLIFGLNVIANDASTSAPAQIVHEEKPSRYRPSLRRWLSHESSTTLTRKSIGRDRLNANTSTPLSNSLESSRLCGTSSDDRQPRFLSLLLSRNKEEWTCFEVDSRVTMGNTAKATVRTTVRNGKRLAKTLKNCSRLPASCQESINEWLSANDQGTRWTLQYAEVTGGASSKMQKAAQKAILGTLVDDSARSVLVVLTSHDDEMSDTASAVSLSVMDEEGVNPNLSKSETKTTRKKMNALVVREMRKRLSKLGLNEAQIDTIVNMETAPKSVIFQTKTAAPAVLPIPNEARSDELKLVDCVGRKFAFPWDTCKTWKGIKGLINDAFVHIDVVGAHVSEGHYDLIDPEGNIILPQVWESTVKPGWEVSMHMWSLPDNDIAPKQPAPTTKASGKALADRDIQHGDLRQNPFHTSLSLSALSKPIQKYKSKSEKKDEQEKSGQGNSVFAPIPVLASQSSEHPPGVNPLVPMHGSGPSPLQPYPPPGPIQPYHPPGPMQPYAPSMPPPPGALEAYPHSYYYPQPHQPHLPLSWNPSPYSNNWNGLHDPSGYPPPLSPQRKPTSLSRPSRVRQSLYHDYEENKYEKPSRRNRPGDMAAYGVDFRDDSGLSVRELRNREQDEIYVQNYERARLQDTQRDAEAYQKRVDGPRPPSRRRADEKRSEEYKTKKDVEKKKESMRVSRREQEKNKRKEHTPRNLATWMASEGVPTHQGPSEEEERGRQNEPTLPDYCSEKSNSSTMRARASSSSFNSAFSTTSDPLRDLVPLPEAHKRRPSIDSKNDEETSDHILAKYTGNSILNSQSQPDERTEAAASNADGPPKTTSSAPSRSIRRQPGLKSIRSLNYDNRRAWHEEDHEASADAVDSVGEVVDGNDDVAIDGHFVDNDIVQIVDEGPTMLEMGEDNSRIDDRPLSNDGHRPPSVSEAHPPVVATLEDYGD